MGFFTKALKDWLDGAPQPAVQPATGLQCDRDFDRSAAGPIGVLRAWFRGKFYEMDEADAKRLRPTFIRDLVPCATKS